MPRPSGGLQRRQIKEGPKRCMTSPITTHEEFACQKISASISHGPRKPQNLGTVVQCGDWLKRTKGARIWRTTWNRQFTGTRKRQMVHHWIQGRKCQRML